jgi:two-component sensor histidine kinase
MPSLAELARVQTSLDDDDVAHLQRLVASWGLLADLCFADLLLFAPVAGDDDGTGGRFVILGQIRPTTSQTLYRSDWVGVAVDEHERPQVARSYRLDELIEGELEVSALRERVRVQCIPVRHEGRILAVLTRESTPSIGRAPGELERTYVELFNRFARMISAGDFPFADEHSRSEENPRVGDGTIVLDRAGRIEFTSPNGVSALHRIGIHASLEGRHLAELGLGDDIARTAWSFAIPVTEEVERGTGITVVVRCIPLIERGEVSGALVLLRDISELRRRDRLLLSKEATIREIHHRVKNNLQTISSLLRLQSRRLSNAEARAAVDESVQRIQSIALVHDILSRDAGEAVPFVDILRPLLRMVEEGLLPSDNRVHFRLEGDAGELPATAATPLAMVITELLQNVVEHAYPPSDAPVSGEVVLALAYDEKELTIIVTDDGAGLPPGFSMDRSTGLGLSIVRTLVETELDGTISMHKTDGPSSGTVVELHVPVGPTWPASAAAMATSELSPDATRPPEAGGR